MVYQGSQRTETSEKLAFKSSSRVKLVMSENKYHKKETKDFDPAALLQAVGKDKDRAAFVAIFDYYAPRVKSYLMKNGADETQAEEIVQNTFVTIWEKAASYNRDKAAASTWIFTIARNKRIDALRKEKFITYHSDALVLEQAADAPDVAYADSHAVQSLNTAIETLPAEQSKLLRMAFFEEKSHSAISKETDLPLGTVKSRLRLAMDKLRGLLKKEDV